LKTTVLAGIFTPIAKVSVANKTFISPFEKRISTISSKLVEEKIEGKDRERERERERGKK
jgi:hypothetical protein